MPDGERDGMKGYRAYVCPEHGIVQGDDHECGNRVETADLVTADVVRDRNARIARLEAQLAGAVSRAEKAEAGMHSVLLAYRVKELECQRLREQVDDLSLPREDDRG